MKLVALAIVASCASQVPPPPHNTQTVAIAPITALEGRVVDSMTGVPVPGVTVDVESGSSYDGVISDEHGGYRVEVAAGSAYVQLDDEAGTFIPLAPGQVTTRDLRVDHATLVQRRTQRPPPACPSSPPGTIILGHSLPQAELDAIAHRVLERYARDPSTVPDGALAPHIRYVRATLAQHRVLGRAALPAGFVGKTTDELADEAAHTGSDVFYVDLQRVDANPTCAIVSIGTDFAAVPKPGTIKACCCSAEQIYELRGGRWEFVRDAGHVCA